MTKAHRLKIRKLKFPLAKNIPLNFLLGCPQSSLDNFVLARWAAVADLRKQWEALGEQMMHEMALAMVAEWFRTVDTSDLRRALENPEDVMAWAREQIRKQGREEDFPPLPALPQGAAHLAAALRYAERNLAEGLCSLCPKPLANHSVRYCEEHLAKARDRKARKRGVKGEPGTASYLYGEIAESKHGRQPGTLQSLALSREKKTRELLAELGIKPEDAAVTLGAAKEALPQAMPRTRKDALKQSELREATTVPIPTKNTCIRALNELLAEGKIERIGRGGPDDPYRYFAADLDRTKRELASSHAVENAGLRLRGPRG